MQLSCVHAKNGAKRIEMEFGWPDAEAKREAPVAVAAPAPVAALVAAPVAAPLLVVQAPETSTGHEDARVESPPQEPSGRSEPTTLTAASASGSEMRAEHQEAAPAPERLERMERRPAPAAAPAAADFAAPAAPLPVAAAQMSEPSVSLGCSELLTELLKRYGLQQLPVSQAAGGRWSLGGQMFLLREAGCDLLASHDGGASWELLEALLVQHLPQLQAFCGRDALAPPDHSDRPTARQAPREPREPRSVRVSSHSYAPQEVRAKSWDFWWRVTVNGWKMG
eukprot:s1337_g7.t1